MPPKNARKRQRKAAPVQRRKRGRLFMRGNVSRAPRTYSFIRTCTSNNRQGTGLLLKTSGIGALQFVDSAAIAAGNCLTMAFTLSGVSISINNTVVINALLTSIDFTSLFDDYMIEKVVVTPMMSYVTQGSVTGVSGNAVQAPYCIYATDDDDSQATEAEALMQYSGAKWTQFMHPNGVKPLVTVYPKTLVQLYNAGGTAGNMPRRGWVDCVNSALPHYGLKFALDSGNVAWASNTTIGTLDFIFQYHLKFRGVI